VTPIDGGTSIDGVVSSCRWLSFDEATNWLVKAGVDTEVMISNKDLPAPSIRVCSVSLSLISSLLSSISASAGV
jgi:hypothetical protein